MKTRVRFLSIAIVLFISTAASLAQASLVVSDFQTAGDGLLVTDTATNLVWLSPRATNSVTYNAVVGGYNGLVTTQGFTVASATQVQSMFAQNFNNPTTVQSADNVPKVQAFFSIFGITDNVTCPGTTPPGACPRTQGWSLDSPGNLHALGMITIGNGAQGNVTGFTGTVASYGADNDPQFGTWLVRLPCPVNAPANGALGTCPSTLASGSSCQVSCSTGYAVAGVATTCSSGTLTLQTCLPAACAVSAPANGTLGTCPPTLASGSSCQLSCSAGYTLTGAATSCLFGGLTAQMCAPNPCSVTAPANGALGTCPSVLPSGGTCQISCSAGYTVTGANTSCIDGSLTGQICTVAFCSPGSVSSNGLQPCQPCSAGQFSPNSGGTSCTSCSPGTYSPQGASVCAQCNPGFFTASPGSASCTPCPLGSIAPNVGSASCTPCGLGTYETSSVACSSCPPGTQAPVYGSTACSPCADGTYSATGAVTCSACPAGYTSTPDHTSCQVPTVLPAVPASRPWSLVALAFLLASAAITPRRGRRRGDSRCG
jgi:hypothetical protein